jgi:hypothetical protein
VFTPAFTPPSYADHEVEFDSQGPHPHGCWIITLKDSSGGNPTEIGCLCRGVSRQSPERLGRFSEIDLPLASNSGGGVHFPSPTSDHEDKQDISGDHPLGCQQIMVSGEVVGCLCRGIPPQLARLERTIQAALADPSGYKAPAAPPSPLEPAPKVSFAEGREPWRDREVKHDPAHFHLDGCWKLRPYKDRWLSACTCCEQCVAKIPNEKRCNTHMRASYTATTNTCVNCGGKMEWHMQRTLPPSY